MARTPLFRMLERCLRTAECSLRTGRGADEIASRARERKESRRRFLQQTAALAAIGGLSGCHFVPAPKRSAARVLVVGAGIAGLTAAFRLQQAGVNVQLLEAQQRVGGRIYSVRDQFADRQVAELGAELIDSDHRHMRGLATELGLPLDDLLVGAESDLRLYFDGRSFREPEVVAAFKPVVKLMKQDMLPFLDDKGRFKRITYREHHGAQPVDRLSMAEWLDRHDVRGWFRKLLEVGYVTEKGIEADKLSALEFLTTTGTVDDGFEIFGDSDERYHVRGGNDRITAGLRDRLGSSVRPGMRLEAVRRRADGLLEISVRSDRTSRELAADYVVLAVPFTLLREVKLDAGLDLSPLKRRAIDKLAHGHNTKLMLGFTERWWQTKHGASGETFTDLGYQSGWETSRQQPGNSGILTNFMGGQRAVDFNEDRPADEIANISAELNLVFPGITAVRNNRHALFHWPSQPFARCSYSALGPGDWTTLRGVPGEAAGNLHFAGEHCSLDHYGFMEGGAETGNLVAREVLAALGIQS